VFKEIMLKVYREKLTGPVPKFPARMEQSINAYLEGGSPDGENLLTLSISAIRAFDSWPGRSSRANGEWPHGFFPPRITNIPENAARQNSDPHTRFPSLTGMSNSDQTGEPY
jgi:hypothetical protein